MNYMKKLFTFLTMLLIGIGSMWATDGSVTLTQSKVYFLRQKGDAGLYINVTSENATYLSSTGSPLVSINQGGGNIHVSDFGLYTQTYTLAMPSNYTITSYVLTVTPAANQTLVVGNGTADVPTLAQNTKTTITVSGVNAYSTTFQFKNNGGNGYNYIESIVVNYSYTTTPTIVHTMDDLECADYSDCPTYTLDCQRSTLYAESNILTTVHAIEYSGGTPVDANKAFAFIKNTSTGAYYLYHVATGKFVTGNGNKQLSTTPTDAVNLYWTLNFSYPAFVKLGSNFINVQTSGGSSGGVLVNGYATADGGNSIAISPAGTADLTRAYKIVNGWTATYHISGTSLTATGNLTFNGALSLPGTLKRAYCTYKYYSDAECEHEITTANDVYDDIYVKYTVSDCPFEFSTEGSPIYYLLTGPSHNSSYTVKYLYSDGSKPVGTETPSKADAYQWAFIGNPYGFVIKNKAGNYISAKATMAATGASFNLYQNTKAIEQIKNHFCAGIFDGKNQTLLNDANQGTTIACYTSTSGAITFTDDIKINNMQWSYFTPMLASDYAVMTYNLIWDDPESPIQTAASILGVVGENASNRVPWSVPAYCSFSYDVETIESTTTEVNVTMTWDGPFAISPDFENANWYYLKMHGQYLINSGSTSCSLTDLATAETAGYNAFWAFVGDPLNGFQMINKAAGSDKNLVVSSSSWTPSMGDGETKLLLQKWNDDFALRTSSYLYLNNVDGTLKLWVSGTSTEGKNFDCSVESASYRGLALDFIDDYANDHALGQYFGVSTATYNSVRASYADAASVSESDYTSLVSLVSGMLPASYPETGYYRIKSNSGRYIGYGQPVADPMPSVGLRTVSAEDAAKDVSTIIRLVKGVGSHQYTLSTEGLNVQSMKSSNTPFPATNDVGATFVLTASTTNPGKGTICNAASDDDGSEYINGYLHESTWSVPGVVNWSASSPNSQWVVEDATGFDVAMNGPVDGNYYATLCVPFDVTISDATAYTLAKSESGNYLVPKEVEGNQVPAGTPVLLKGTNLTATATINTDSDFGSPLTCALTGTYVAKTIDSSDYVLGKKDEKVGFYHWNSNNLGANRAYLEATTNQARGFALMFDDDATGIVAPTADTAGETTIYNLSGQRLNKMQKGINIVNGKKVLF